MWTTRSIISACEVSFILFTFIARISARDKTIVDYNNGLRRDQGQVEQRDHRCALPVVIGDGDDNGGDGDDTIQLDVAKTINRYRVKPAIFYEKPPIVYREPPVPMYLRRRRPVAMIIDRPSEQRLKPVLRYYYNDRVPPVRTGRIRYVLVDNGRRNVVDEDAGGGGDISLTADEGTRFQ